MEIRELLNWVREFWGWEELEGTVPLSVLESPLWPPPGSEMMWYMPRGLPVAGIRCRQKQLLSSLDVFGFQKLLSHIVPNCFYPLMLVPTLNLRKEA